MKKLEQFIHDHAGEFDAEEPGEGHLLRFEERLSAAAPAHPAGINRPMFLKLAAVILLMITVSVVVFDAATRAVKSSLSASVSDTDLPVEIREAVQYYDNQATTGMAAIRQLAANHDGAGKLGTDALKEITSLDATTEELKKALAENPGNEKITDAIIRNQQMKEAILNTIITRLSKANK